VKLTIVGTGYVGLVTGACFAEYGNTVVCVDTNEQKIEMLCKAIIPLYEPGLEESVKNNISAGTLTFTTDIQEAINTSDAVFICVGTPQTEDGSTDLSYVRSAAQDIGAALERDMVIVNKSTVPVGTASLVKAIVEEQLAARGRSYRIAVVSNPEFLKEGTAVSNCMCPERVIIGTDDEQANALMEELYFPFLARHEQYIEMDIKSAEMTKYAANAMLATKISFINEIANICERVGADVSQVRVGIGSDSRIGYSFIYPGMGYGGGCFPKDIRSLVCTSASFGYEAQLLRAVDEVNNRQKNVLNTRISTRFSGDLAKKTFAVWGLAFKPNTDDMREAASITVIRYLLDHGAAVRCYDPKAMAVAPEYLGEHAALSYGEDKYEILDGADALLLLTEWKDFRNPDFERVKDLLAQPLIFDGKNQFDDATMRDLGFEYLRIGLG
jgi:UDPglucose 6-dehydrogenase